MSGVAFEAQLMVGYRYNGRGYTIHGADDIGTLCWCTDGSRRDIVYREEEDIH